MKDIPIFTGYEGIASLILRQIPYNGTAFVLIRSVFGTTEALIRECAEFCHAAGAETVCYGGDGDFSGREVYAHVIERTIRRSALPKTAAVARPAADPNEWLGIYRQRFSNVPAATCFPSTQNALTVFDGDTPIGIGRVEGGCIRLLAATVPGRGADCVAALAAHCLGKIVTLSCAEENLPAMRLYDRLGFSRGATKEIWYR